MDEPSLVCESFSFNYADFIDADYDPTVGFALSTLDM